MEERQALDWIPLTSRTNGDARRLPLSKSSLYRLACAGLISLRKVDGRVCAMKQEVDSILSMLRKDSLDD